MAGQLLEGVPEDDLSRAGVRRILPGVRWLKNRVGAVGQNRMTVGSLIFLVGIVLFCFVGPLLYQTNETHTNLLLANQAPSARHILGTSPAGFDELGQLMVGGQSTLEVGFAVAVLASSFGLIWGLVAGYMGGWVDAVMMRIVDALLSVPFLFFVVVLAAIVNPTLPLTIVVLSAASWLSTARLARGESLSLRTREYVEAARVSGARASRMMVRHIAPNLLGTVMVNATLKVADAILAFAAMSYLGLGPPAPATNWGLIVTNGINNIFDGYWWQLWPAGLLIVATALAVNILGDGMRDLVEKRHQQR
jgi:ABC-type dipeptide/oligopeptide/nickel transport system permease subunit